MNKRVKSLQLWVLRLKSVVVKNSVMTDTGVKNLTLEASAKNIAKLIEAGANTFRFNFSHGDHQEQR